MAEDTPKDAPAGEAEEAPAGAVPAADATALAAAPAPEGAGVDFTATFNRLGSALQRGDLGFALGIVLILIHYVIRTHLDDYCVHQ